MFQIKVTTIIGNMLSDTERLYSCDLGDYHDIAYRIFEKIHQAMEVDIHPFLPQAWAEILPIFDGKPQHSLSKIVDDKTKIQSLIETVEAIFDQYNTYVDEYRYEGGRAELYALAKAGFKTDGKSFSIDIHAHNFKIKCEGLAAELLFHFPPPQPENFYSVPDRIYRICEGEVMKARNVFDVFDTSK